MTRSTLKRTLRRVYALLVVVLGISFVAKIADHIPGLAGTGAEKILKDGYEYLRDMSLLIATGGVAYITNVFQKRTSFVEALKGEWRDIIATKSALFTYTQLERRRWSSIWQRSADCPRPSTTCARSTATSARPTISSASIRLRRCTTCAAPCRRSIRANARPLTPTSATSCAMPSCSRSMRCARRSWRSSTRRHRITRC